MDPILIAGLGFAILLILLFAGVHIGFAMALSGFFGLFLLRISGGIAAGKAFSMALGAFSNGPFTTTNKDSLAVIPLFILMGAVCAEAGISRDLYAACYKWTGRVRGGMAIATELTCALFGAICGSATATAASMGKICLPEMDRYGYKRTLSCGAISAGGTLGLLIPPSTGFMLYGVNAGVGVGKMFLAGIFPGIVLTLCYAGVVICICMSDHSAGPKGESFSMGEKLQSLMGILPVVILFCLVLGGILLGWCSATEGGAVGAFGALLFLLLRGRFRMESLRTALTETAETTAMIFFIMIGSDIFSQFVAMTGVSAALVSFVTSANVNRWLILLFCLLIYGILGCFIDTIPLICLLTPIFLPIIRQLGFDEIWFGVLMVMLMEFGLITPPVGMCCYIMAGITRGTTTLQEIFRGTAPFLAGIGVAIAVIMIFPQLSTWLPGQMIG